MDRVRRMIGCDSREVIPYTGKGIYVGVLDSGVASHPDLRGRIAAFKDFTSDKRTYYDDNGHGTHVCGIACGSGKLSGGRYKGIAPGAKILVGKVLDYNGNGSVFHMIDGIDWVIKNNRDRYDRTVMRAYESLFINTEQRKQIFGF